MLGPIHAQISQVVLFLQVCTPKTQYALSVPPPKMHHVPPVSWTSFDRLYNMWQGVQLTGTFITQFYATSFCDLFRKLSNLFQRPILGNPKPMFFRQGEERSFTPAQTTGKIVIFFVFNFCFQATNKQKKKLFTEWQYALPECNVSLIFSCIQFDSFLSFPDI